MPSNSTEKEIENVMYVGKIHDIGKTKIPIDLLNKIEKLTTEEFDLIKEHSSHGHAIVMETLKDENVAQIVYQHHEKIDGSGYPKGLIGDEITIEARIIMVADSFDAMTKDRPYRLGMDINKVMTELKSYAGTWYDTKVIDALVHVVEQRHGQLI